MPFCAGPEAVVSTNRFFALGLQARGVDEVGERERADFLRGGLAGQRHADGAVVADGQRLRAFRHLDARLQRVAAVGDQLALGVDLEGAVAGVGRGAVGHLHFEEAAAVDHHVERAAGLLLAALVEALERGHHAYAGTQLQAGRQLRLRGGRAAGRTHLLVQQVFERGTVALEAGGIGIGQVVGNDRHARLLRIQSGFGDPQSLIHDPIPR